MQRKNIVLYFIIALLGSLSFYVYVASLSFDQHILTVAFLNVGQGDAIYIEAPQGNQVLIDGGPGQRVLRELGKIMPFYDRSIDVVVATHPDKDHIGGLPEVLDRFAVSYVLEPGNRSENGVYEAMKEIAQEKNIPVSLARRGGIIHLDDSTYIEILFPDRDVSGVDSNDASVFAKLVYGDTSFLFTGDAPQKIEKYVENYEGDSLDVDVLKLGHHGSRTSTSKEFLEATSPEYAVVSAGADNMYGHPHKEVVDLVHGYHIPILNTAEEGMIVFQSDGRDIWIKK